MIETVIICRSNHWPARYKKVNLVVKKLIKFKKDLKFNLNYRYSCNIILSDNNLIKKMNSKFRNKNRITDVLTFVSEIKDQKRQIIKISDIFLSAETIKKDAKINKITFYNHLTHLLIHSFLHINGFKHKQIKDFNKMKNIEIKILKKLGITNPYLEI